MARWLPDEAKEILDAECDVDYLPADRAKLLEIIGSYDAFWGHFDFKVDKPVLERATKLKVVNTTSTGTDHIDKDECARRGIHVLHIAKDLGLLDTFTATAELAWMLMLACHRNMRAATRDAHAGKWGNTERFQGDQLSTRTLGVLGIGRLGKMTVEYGKAFRMKVLGCDLQPFSIPGVEQVDFDTLLRRSDAISIHIHMTAENRHRFNAQSFAKMKRGAVLVNTSRGGIVDEAALLAALDSGQLAAFGSDVLEDEWRADMTKQPVIEYARTHDNVVLTPHIGGASRQSIEWSRVFSAKKLVHFLKTGEELTMPG
jgi:D-3-phosphoglycerate dehydrogenase